jgi:ketosteroid isomerase-like protein
MKVTIMIKTLNNPRTDTSSTFPASGPTNASRIHASAKDTVATVEIVTELIEKSLRSNTALLVGDIKQYREIVGYTDDFMLMGPFGGEPTRGRDLTSERWDAMGRFFKNGTFKQEIVQTYASDNMVVLVIIEYCNAEIGGIPAQEWQLRVTLVYRREGSEWRLAHRHADPLVFGVSRETSAALARGEFQ